MKQPLLRAIIVLACVGGFYLGLRGSQPKSVSSEQASAPTELTDSLVRTVGKTDNVDDWLAQLHAALEDPDSDSLDQLREGSFRSLTKKQLEALIAQVDQETDGFRRSRMIDALATRWAELDPNGAIDYVLERVHRNHQQSPFTQIFEVLAEKDPGSAFETYMTVEQDAKAPHTLGQGLYKVFESWKRSSLKDALAAFEASDIHEHNAGSALYGICRSEDATQRQAIFEAISEITDGPLRQEAWGKAVYSWAKTAPMEDIVQWMDEGVFPEDTTATMERQIAHRKAKESPRKIADWLLTRATHETMSGHLEAAVAEWAHREPNACAEWLHQREPGPHLDQAIETFTRAAARHDIESAFNWAQVIHDAKQRQSALAHVAREWYRRDTASLKAALAESALDPGMQVTLLEEAKR